MSQHTQGPWKTRKGFHDGTIEVFRPNRSIKKPFYPTELAAVNADDKEGKANARLMAAAPELLEALRHIEGVALADEPRDLPGIAQTARAAIKKAEGV